MIDLEDVNKLFTTVGAAISYVPFVFIHADQEGQRPATPYGTYKIINEDIDSLHQNSRTWSPASSPPPYMMLVERGESSRATISINIVGDKATQLAALRLWCKNTLNYFRENKLDWAVALIISPQIQDRTIFLDPDYDYKFGFDIRLVTVEVHQLRVEEVRKVTIGQTVDGDVLDDVVVTKP